MSKASKLQVEGAKFIVKKDEEEHGLERQEKCVYTFHEATSEARALLRPRRDSLNHSAVPNSPKQTQLL